MQKMLITGASGFVGRHLVNVLNTDYQIYEINRYRRKTESVQIVSDLCRRLPELPSDIDVVLHCASVVGYSDQTEKTSYFDVNVRSTLNLLEYSRQIKINKFIYFSSGGIYGFSHELLNELSAANPADFYSLTKHISELLVNHFENDFDIQIIRPFFPYGPRQKGRFIPNLTKTLLDNKPIKLNNPHGSPKINPIYIDDLAELTNRLIQSDFCGTVNIAGKEIVTVKELAEIIAKLLMKKPTFEFLNKPSKDMIGDISKITDLTGYSPNVGVEEGISKVLAHVAR